MKTFEQLQMVKEMIAQLSRLQLFKKTLQNDSNGFT